MVIQQCHLKDPRRHVFSVPAPWNSIFSEVPMALFLLYFHKALGICLFQ